MKKISLIAILCIAMFGSINSTNAQNWGAGGGLSFLKFGGDGESKMHFAPGLRGRWDNDDRIAVSFGFNFYLPNTYSNEISIYPNSTYVGTIPSATGSYETKVSALHIFAHGNYYLVGESAGDEFGLYGVFGLGFLNESVKSEFTTSADKSKYNVAAYEASSESAGGATIDIGVGFDMPVSSMKIFGEAQLNLPANSANGEEIEVKINSSYCFNLGVRIPFGN